MKMKHHEPSGAVDLTNWELGPNPLFYKHFEKITDRIEKSIKKIQKDLEKASAWNFQDKLMIDVSSSIDFVLKERPNNGIDFDIRLDSDGRLIAIIDLPLSENEVRFTAKLDECIEELLFWKSKDDHIYRLNIALELRKLADKLETK